MKNYDSYIKLKGYVLSIEFFNGFVRVVLDSITADNHLLRFPLTFYDFSFPLPFNVGDFIYVSCHVHDHPIFKGMVEYNSTLISKGEF